MNATAEKGYKAFMTPFMTKICELTCEKLGLSTHSTVPAWPNANTYWYGCK